MHPTLNKFITRIKEKFKPDPPLKIALINLKLLNILNNKYKLAPVKLLNTDLIKIKKNR